MMSLVRSFIILVLFATNGSAQTSSLEQLLQQQSQGLPFGTDLQSLENMLSGQGFDTNLLKRDARTAKEPVIPNEQNVKLLDRRLTAEEAQQRVQEGQALSNDLLVGNRRHKRPRWLKPITKFLLVKTWTCSEQEIRQRQTILHDPADELLFFNSLDSDYRLAAGDVLAISIRGLSSIDEEAVVDGEGKIAMPKMLPVIVQGVPSRMCKVTLSKSWKSMMRLPTCMSAL
jgi:hypothetical protein